MVICQREIYSGQKYFNPVKKIPYDDFQCKGRILQSMQNMQEIFDQIQELKQTRKEIGKEYRDALAQTSGYQEVTDEIKKLREKKKLLESGAQSEMGSRYEELETAKNEIISLEEMLTDIAMTNLMDGKNINIKDKNNVKYEPSYKITFKKIV